MKPLDIKDSIHKQELFSNKEDENVSFVCFLFFLLVFYCYVKVFFYNKPTLLIRS